MKISRPKRPDVDFKRKRTPPPQATKLLRYSLGSGVVFMILLAIVFLPRMFGDQTPVAIIGLRSGPIVGARLDIDTVTAALDLGKFRANLTRNDTYPSMGRLGPGLTGGNATLRFVDANHNGLLDPGDYFEMSATSPGIYRFEIFQVDVNRRVALTGWGA